MNGARTILLRKLKSDLQLVLRRMRNEMYKAAGPHEGFVHQTEGFISN